MKAKSFILPAVFFVLALMASAATPPPRDPPLPVRTVKPEYPPAMRAQKVSGIVLVKCSIDEQGNVVEAVVSKTSNVAFDQCAVEAVKRWKFKPGTVEGQAAAISVTIPIKFNADEAS